MQRETLTGIERDIRKELIRLVKIGDINTLNVTYKALAEQFGLPYDEKDYNRNLFHEILGHISEFEDTAGRPLLSVIVVRIEDGFPGKGFHTMAKQQKKQKPDEDNETFVVNERKKVFDWWKTHDDEAFTDE